MGYCLGYHPHKLGYIKPIVGELGVCSKRWVVTLKQMVGFIKLRATINPLIVYYCMHGYAVCLYCANICFRYRTHMIPRLLTKLDQDQVVSHCTILSQHVNFLRPNRINRKMCYIEYTFSPWNLPMQCYCVCKYIHVSVSCVTENG